MAKKYTADTFDGNVTGNVTGSASSNVLKSGDTMTGALNINSSGSGQLKCNSNRAVFGTHYTGTDVWIYANNNGDNIFLGGGIGSIQNNVLVEDGYIYTGEGLRVGGTGTANELDDYEEGTYNFQFRLFRDNNSDGETIGSSGFSAFTNRSKYTKIGNQVTLYLDVEYQNGSSTKWSTSNTYYVGIDNLPFTPIDNGTGIRDCVGGTYALRSFYQNSNTGHTIFSREGGYSNWGKYIALGGTLFSSYPGYAFDPIYSNEMPQYRQFSSVGNVHLTGTVTYQTNA